MQRLAFDMTDKYNIENFEGYSSSVPLVVEEVMDCLRRRWGVTYDLKLLVKGKRVYLQMMWRFLEQQSFPMDEETYKENLNQTLEIINRGGQSEFVRTWLQNVESKPRLGRAISLPLIMDERLGEFVL